MKRRLSKKTESTRRLIVPRAGLALLSLVLVCLAGAQSRWAVEVVEGAGQSRAGQSASLKMDKLGNFHLAYYDERKQVLRYAFRAKDKDQWDTMTVDQGGSTVDLAVDDQGHPHFAYLARNLEGLRYAMWDGKKWQKQTLDSQPISFFLAIRLSKDGLPRISYYQRLKPDRSYALHLKYAYFDGKVWYTETVDYRDETGKYNSLALDSQGRPHIMYTDVRSGDLLHAYWDGQRWVYGVADLRRAHLSYVGSGNSVAADAQDNLHVAYFDITRRALKYAKLRQGVWETEFVTQLTGRPVELDRVSIAIDSQGRPHIAFHDSGIPALKYAVREKDRWRVEVVDSDGVVGLYASLCLDARDQPYIAYQDAENGALRFARRAGTSTQQAAKTQNDKP